MARKLTTIVGHDGGRETQVVLVARMQVALGILVAGYLCFSADGDHWLPVVVAVVAIVVQTIVAYVLLQALAEILASTKKSIGIPTTLVIATGAPIEGLVCEECEVPVGRDAFECPNCRVEFDGMDSRRRPDSER